VRRKCCNGDETSQWKRPKFDPSPRQKPLTDLHQNWRAWLCHGDTWHTNFCSNRFRGFSPQIRDIAVPLVWLVFLRFLVHKATVFTLEWIFTQKMPNNTVQSKLVPLGCSENYYLIFISLNFRVRCRVRDLFWPELFLDYFFAAENLFNVEAVTHKLLNRHRSPQKFSGGSRIFKGVTLGTRRELTGSGLTGEFYAFVN